MPRRLARHSGAPGSCLGDAGTSGAAEWGGVLSLPCRCCLGRLGTCSSFVDQGVVISVLSRRCGFKELSPQVRSQTVFPTPPPSLSPLLRPFRGAAGLRFGRDSRSVRVHRGAFPRAGLCLAFIGRNFRGSLTPTLLGSSRKGLGYYHAMLTIHIQFSLQFRWLFESSKLQRVVSDGGLILPRGAAPSVVRLDPTRVPNVRGAVSAPAGPGRLPRN